MGIFYFGVWDGAECFFLHSSLQRLQVPTYENQLLAQFLTLAKSGGGAKNNGRRLAKMLYPLES
mgnify:CR=1 FL=1